MIDDILEFNKKFVESKGYEKYITNNHKDIYKMKTSSK